MTAATATTAAPAAASASHGGWRRACDRRRPPECGGGPGVSQPAAAAVFSAAPQSRQKRAESPLAAWQTAQLTAAGGEKRLSKEMVPPRYIPRGSESTLRLGPVNS